jgi:AraC-like DNA-binding protein
MMPNLNGLELIKRIRNNEECNHLPIIVVSARTDNNDRLAGFDAGAEVYIGKPFNPDELLLCIHKLLEQRDLLKKKYSSQIEDSDLNDNKEMYVNCKKSDQEFIQRIDEFIHKNITDRTLNATILASYMAMSITTLNRKINSVANTNTTNYIRMRRLSRAKYLLQNTEMTMGEIQAVCGFESPSYFSRAFKSEYNISPTEFRKTNTN